MVFFQILMNVKIDLVSVETVPVSTHQAAIGATVTLASR